MVSILSVPKQKASDASHIELKPGHIREKLAKLPLLDSQDSLEKILDLLYEFNRVPIVPGLRLRTLELYRTPIAFVVANIEKTLAESYVPLSDSHARLADTCTQVTAEMAYGYKSVVIDLAKGGRTKKQQEDLRTAIQRSIKYLTLSLHQSAMHYTDYGSGTWVEIHSLYTYARKIGIHDKLVKDAMNRSNAENSVSHAYQQALLFGLSDSYRHPVPINAKTLRYLDRWASAVEVTPFKTPEASQFHFVIDVEEDRPARAYSKDIDVKKSKRFMLLNTREIAKITHNFWKQMDSGTQLKSSSLGEEFFDASAYEMLKLMAVGWGNAPQRQHPRNVISDPYEVAIGVDAGNYFLNGSSSFNFSPANTSQIKQISTSGTLDLHQIEKHDQGFVAQDWHGRNESIMGLCLSVDLSKPANVRIRVGEIVAFRPNSVESKWSIGLVRWVRITDTELRMGLEKIGVGAKPVAVKPVAIEDAVEMLFKNSILLPRLDTIRQIQSLITPPGAYKLHGNLIVDDGQTLTTVRANRLIEYGRRYEWFDYELVETR